MMNARNYVRLLALLFALACIGTATAADTVTYYHTDALGTPVMESNAAGTITYTREHRPYGEQALGAAKHGPGFTGHVGDMDTGLTYMQARYFDPVAGRFLGNDPVAADLKHGGNYNRYWYANNNPYRFTDPDGRISKEMKRQGFEEIGDGFVVRVDQFRGSGGEAGFEVHVYKDSKVLEKAVESGDLKGVRSAEINTLKSNGEWGKHGKPAEAPDLGKKGQAGFDKVVQREVSARGWTVKKSSGRLELRDDIRRNLGKYSRYLGPAGALLEYTRSSVDRACEIDPTSEVCS